MDMFAARLKILVSDNDVKQKALAKHLQVSEGTLSNYIKGVHEPSFDSVVKIAAYFHVSTDYLFGLSDLPDPPLNLNREEYGLVDSFRTLGREDKEFIRQSVRLLAEKNRK